MKKLTSKILHTLVLVALSAGGAFAQTGNPYFNVMDPAYGAKCDGTTNDTVAIQSALTAASNVRDGGTVFIPSSAPGPCVITTHLVMDNYRGVRIVSSAQTEPGTSSPSHATLQFTGASGPLLSMHSSAGITLEGLYLSATNSSLTGNFIEMTNSNQNRLKSLLIFGTASTPVLLSLDNSLESTLDSITFGNAQVYIQGAASSTSFSNSINLLNCVFSANPGTAYIQNPGGNWSIIGSVFELGPGAPVVQFVNGFVSWEGFHFVANYIDDANPQPTRTYTMFSFPAQASGSGNGGATFESNLIDTCCSNQTGFSFGNNTTGIVITGNDIFTTVGTLISVGTGVDITVGSNHYGGTISTFLSGTPSSGSIQDNGGTTTIYGSAQFNSNLSVYGTANFFGTLNKPAGSFKIDHPLDPANKFLRHSFVESPDMMNIYNGVATLDSRGKAMVKLPEYFEALNQDFRYQLTCIGGAAPVYIAREIRGNSFLIAGGRPGLKVSWQVTGIRHDAYANAHRIVVEEEKPVQEKGHYLYPALFEQPANEAVQVRAKPGETKLDADHPGHE